MEVKSRLEGEMADLQRHLNDKNKVLYICLLYVAWANQSALFVIQNSFDGTVLYDGQQGEGGQTFAFQLASSPAREATRRATRRFCKLFQPARERGNRPVYLDTHRVQSKRSRLAQVRK